MDSGIPYVSQAMKYRGEQPLSDACSEAGFLCSSDSPTCTGMWLTGGTSKEITKDHATMPALCVKIWIVIFKMLYAILQMLYLVVCVLHSIAFIPLSVGWVQHCSFNTRYTEWSAEKLPSNNEYFRSTVLKRSHVLIIIITLLPIYNFIIKVTSTTCVYYIPFSSCFTP